MTFGTGLYVYISGPAAQRQPQPRRSSRSTGSIWCGARRWWSSAPGSHRFKGGTLAIIDDDVYLATTAISTPRNAAWIADHSDSDDEFIHLTASGGGALSFSDLSGTASTSQIPNLPATKITSGIFGSARIPTVPISKGGTGATTASPARTALSAAEDNLSILDAGLSDNEQDTIKTKLGLSTTTVHA